jgi:pimeloyl-ACP methyl ester carboxylesterase
MQLGCDPVELERLVPPCRALVAMLDATTARLARVGRAPWRGPSADRWRSDMLTPLLAQLPRCAVGLETLALALQEQADQQRRASLGPVATATRAAAAHGPGTWVGRTTAQAGPGPGVVTVALVPGVGTTAADAPELAADAERLWEELAVVAERSTRLGEGAQSRVVVVPWLGYDPPDDLIAGLARSPASEGARQLADDVAAWRAEGAQRVVLVGHSYGAVVGARASALGAAPDELVLLGAPGLGVGSFGALALRDGADLWAATAQRDPIGWVARTGLVHGPDPLPLARRLPTSRTGHSSYLEDPVLLAALAELSVGDPTVGDPTVDELSAVGRPADLRVVHRAGTVGA